MIKPIYILWIFGLVIFLNILACSKDEVTDISACIAESLEHIESWACPNSTVNEYRFQHKTVYVFNTDLCFIDGGADVLDINCNSIGYLYGYTGNSKIDGVEFFENAKFIRTLWEN